MVERRDLNDRSWWWPLGAEHLGGNLVIAHETIDRNAYMPGVLLACKKVMSLKKLVYGLESFL